MKTLAPCLVILLVLLLAGCNSSPHSQLRHNVEGEYCAEGYHLSLKDSSYHQTKMVYGLTSKVPFKESCLGKYRILQKNNNWIIRFEQDAQTRSFRACQHEFVLAPVAANQTLPDIDQFPDLFDNKLLKRCD